MMEEVLSPAPRLEGEVQLRLGDEFSHSEWETATLALEGDMLLYSTSSSGSEGTIALDAILTPPQRMSGWTWGDLFVFVLSSLLQPVYIQVQPPLHPPCPPPQSITLSAALSGGRRVFSHLLDAGKPTPEPRTAASSPARRFRGG